MILCRTILLWSLTNLHKYIMNLSCGPIKSASNYSINSKWSLNSAIDGLGLYPVIL